MMFERLIDDVRKVEIDGVQDDQDVDTVDSRSNVF